MYVCGGVGMCVEVHICVHGIYMCVETRGHLWYYSADATYPFLSFFNYFFNFLKIFETVFLELTEEARLADH